MSNAPHRIVATLLLSALCACTGVPDGVTVVRNFDVDRYLGTWYEIARLDHSFERGLSEVTAEYTLRNDDGIRVVNRGYDTSSGEWNEAVGKAYFVGSTDAGMLKVSFFGPFYGGYNIIALDHENYEYSMVAGPDREYLWILSRSPEMDPAVLGNLVNRAKELGFAIDDLIYVVHSQ
jgi:apolipoprotein D and lipocalin family protein